MYHWLGRCFTFTILTATILFTQTQLASAKNIEPFDPLVHTWPHDISDISPDPNIIYGELENGLRYAVHKNSRPVGEVVVRFRVLAGRRNETEETRGLAHFLEHMAFNGSENIPEGEIYKSLERLGLRRGADANASINFSRTEYKFDLPKNDEKTIDYGLFVIREIADKLLITPEAVKKERPVIKAEAARRNSPNLRAARAYLQYVNPESLAAKRPTGISSDTIDNISVKQLRSFYQTHYRPERSILVLVGDFDIEAVRQKIEQTFGDWRNETAAPVDPDNGFAENLGLQAKTYEDEGLVTSLRLRSSKPATKGPDLKAARRDAVIRTIANGIVNQRIERKRLANEITARGARLSFIRGMLEDSATASVAVANNDWRGGLYLAQQEIQTALVFGFQQTEYDQIRQTIVRRATDAVNNGKKRRSTTIANIILGAFGGGVVPTNPQQRLKEFEEYISNATLDVLEKAFHGMWADFDPSIWLQGPDTNDVSEQAILQAYKMASQQAAIKPNQQDKITFAYQNFGKAGSIKSRSNIDEFDIDQIVFDNNVRLNLKKTDFEDKKIHVRVTVGEGASAFPKASPGLARLANSIELGGYEAHKISELSQIFAGKDISVDMRISPERLIFGNTTNSDDIDAQFNVWAAMLVAAGYRAEWPEKFRQDIESRFHTIEATPGGIARRDLGRIWTNGDRRYGLLSKDEYLELAVDDVREVLQPIFENGAIEIGVVGDFNKESVIQAVAQTFAALPVRNIEFNVDKSAFRVNFPAADRVQLKHKGPKDQGAAYIGWPTAQPWTIERARAYGIIRSIMRNRLIEVVREDLGLAYAPRISLNFAERTNGYGYLSAHMSADPQYFDAFETAAVKIANDLRDGGVTQDEIDRVRNPILKDIRRSLRENRSWLSNVTSSQSNPVYLDYRRSRVDFYDSVTSEFLDRYIEELLIAGTQHVVTITPLLE